MVTKMIRTYSELSRLKTFKERYEYLRLDGVVGEDTFGFDRYLNQAFYKSKEWKDIRRFVIIRDNGCDLGVEGHEIYTSIIIHHMNPIRQQDILSRTDLLMNPEYLISTRCAFTVVPKQLMAYDGEGNEVEVNPLWNRRIAGVSSNQSIEE